jgi:imidazolonepropionase-like amidohydrolase
MIAAAIGTLLLLSGCSEDLPPLVHRPAHAPAAILIKTVDVFDAKAPRIDRNKDVLIRDGIIDSIADGGALIAPTDAEVIDGTGLTLLPGLIDAHAHLDSSPYPPWQLTLPNPDANLQSLLYCGVTTILDPGESDAEAAVSRRKRVESGEQLGPQIFTAGRIITARGGHPVAMAKSLLPWWLAWYVVPRLAHEVDTDEGAREAARVIHASGADVVKIVVDSAPEGTPRISTAQIAAAAEEASNLGLRTITHIGTFEDARDAASGGSSMWVHGVYKEPLDDGQVAELAATGIPMTPTLEVFNSYSRTLDANRVATALESEIAPPGVLEALNDVPEDHPAIATFRPFIEMLARNRQAGADNARRLFEAGVTMLAGSDPQAGVFAGAGLHRELALLSRAGIPNEHVLAAATINAARYLTRSPDPDFGIVAPGKRADLLLVEGDPVADIANVSTIRAVILRGEVLKRQARR